MGYLDNKQQQAVNAKKAQALDSMLIEKQKNAIYNQGKIDTEMGMAAMLNRMKQEAAMQDAAEYYDVPGLQPGQYTQPPMSAMEQAIQSSEPVLPSPQTMPGLAGSIAGTRG